jgi:hypothetical protein
MATTRLALAAALVVPLLLHSFAQAPAPPPAAPVGPPAVGEPATIFRFGDLDKTCLQWTDGCRNCGRDASAAPVCSNIGIACQPGEVKCTARQADALK